MSTPRTTTRTLIRSKDLGGRAMLPRRPLSIAISAVLVAGPLRVVAQDAPVIEEIIVTATRRSESIQDIPINIAALSGDMLDRQEITDLSELGRTVPGLYVIDQGKRNANYIVVRGLNLDSIRGPEGLPNNGGNTVATYVGDIPLYIDFDLTDMDRVEVLLGPQGTLYGSGTLGGAIRYMPNRPEFDAPSLEFRASTFDLAESADPGARGSFTGNFPLSDNLALRTTVSYYDDPGFIDTPYLVREAGVSDPEPDFSNPADVAANLYSARDTNYEQTLSGRVGLRWQPSDKLDANFSYFYQDMEVGGRSTNNVLSFGTGRYESATRFPEPIDRKNELVAAEIVADLGFAELTSATGYSRYKDHGQRDQTDLLITLEYSYEAFPFFSAFTFDSQLDRTLSQELRLVSTGNGRSSWIAGLFYLDQTSSQPSIEYAPHYDEYLGGVLRPDSIEYYSLFDSALKEQGLFGEFSYDFTDRWQVTVGGRFYDYDYTTLSSVVFPLFSTAVGDLAPDEFGFEFDTTGQQDDGFLYKFNTAYRFTDDLMGYVTISEGYRIGAANGIPLCDPSSGSQQTVCTTPEEFQFFPDKTTNYEVGMRSQWLDRRLTINAAMYFIDWKDPQLNSATVAGSQPIKVNGKGAESKGFELSIAADITDRLDIAFSYSVTKAELTEDAPSLLPLIVPPGFGPAGLFVDGEPGDRLPGSPEKQGTFAINYNVPLSGGWNAYFNYGVQAIGNVITRTGLRADGETLSGFTVHSASLMFDKGSWSVGLYGQNLTNEYAVTGVRTTPPYIQTVADENGDPVTVRSYTQNVLRPRELGFKFNYRLDL